jgi:hypothetical protein
MHRMIKTGTVWSRTSRRVQAAHNLRDLHRPELSLILNCEESCGLTYAVLFGMSASGHDSVSILSFV